MTPYRKYQSAGSVPNSSFGSAYKYKGWQPPAFKPSSNPQFANSKRYLSDEPDEPKGGKVDWMGIGTAALNAGVGIANTVMTANKNIDLVGKEQRKKLNQEQALGLYRVNNQPYVGTNYAQTGGSIGNEYTGWQSPYGGIAEGYDPKLAAMSTQGILQKRNADIGLGVSDMVIEAASTAFPLIGALNAAQKSIRSGMGETAGQNREGKNVQTYDNLDAAAAGSTMKPLWEYASEHFAEGDIVRGLGSVFGGGLFQDINDNIRDTQDKLESQAVNQVSRSSGRTLGNASYASGSNVSARPMTSSSSSGGKMSLNRAQTGGQMGTTKIEIENNEVLWRPDGTHRTQDAPSHKNGGRIVSAEDGTKVFADNDKDEYMKYKGKTMAEWFQEIEKSPMSQSEKYFAKNDLFKMQESFAGRAAPMMNDEGVQIAQTGLNLNSYGLSNYATRAQRDSDFIMQGAVPPSELYKTATVAKKPAAKKPVAKSVTKPTAAPVELMDPEPLNAQEQFDLDIARYQASVAAHNAAKAGSIPTAPPPPVVVGETVPTERTKAGKFFNEYGVQAGLLAAGALASGFKYGPKMADIASARPGPPIDSQDVHLTRINNLADEKAASEAFAKSLDSSMRYGEVTSSHARKNMSYLDMTSALEQSRQNRDQKNSMIDMEERVGNAQRQLAADSENSKYQFLGAQAAQELAQAKDAYTRQRFAGIGETIAGTATDIAKFQSDREYAKSIYGPETGMYASKYSNKTYARIMDDLKSKNAKLSSESEADYQKRLDQLYLRSMPS